MRKTLLAVVAGAAIVALTGCSVANTAPDQFGLHYDAGMFSSTQFENCIEPGQRNVDGPGDEHYYYPAGQRTLTFNNDESADFGEISATSAAPQGQQVFVTGSARFRLNIANEDGTLNCDALKAFHESIGIKYENGEDWSGILRDYLQTPLTNAVNEATKQFTWQDLAFDVDGAKQKWADYIVTKMPEYVERSVGSDIFIVEGVTLAPVRLPDDLQNAQNQFNVNTQLDAAQQAQNTRTLSEADGLKPLIAALGVDGALQYILNKAIADGKVPNPVIVNGDAPIAIPR